MWIPYGTPMTSCTWAAFLRYWETSGPNVSGGSSSLPPHAEPAESLKSWGHKTVIYPLSFEGVYCLMYLQNIVVANYPSYPSSTGPGLYATVFTGGVSRASSKKGVNPNTKEIQIILRLFLVIAMYCQASSSQLKSITQPLRLLAGWEGFLGTCRR